MDGGDQTGWRGRLGKVGCFGDNMNEGVDEQRWDGVVMGRAAAESSEQRVDGLGERVREVWAALGDIPLLEQEGQGGESKMLSIYVHVIYKLSSL